MLDCQAEKRESGEMSESPYTPVACAVYDYYEIGIMQHRQLLLKTAEGEIIVRPLALKIQSGAEYLLYQQLEPAVVEEEIQQRLRLDEIIHVEFVDNIS